MIATHRSWLIVTPEYPPGCGGVGDYTQLVATALARAGDHVAVWTRPSRHLPLSHHGFEVNVLPDDFGPKTVRALGLALRGLPRDGVVLAQYVPQGFGWKGTNVPFLAWLGSRRERVWLMVHEPLYPFVSGQPLRHDLLAVLTRLMLRVATQRSEHVFVSTPAWESYVLRWGRPGLRPEWLPIPATMGADENGGQRAERASPPATGSPSVAHFGTYGELVARPLARVLLPLLGRNPDLDVLLIGRGSERFRSELTSNLPHVRERVKATGSAEPSAIVEHLRNATVALFPFQEGASSRRTSLMSALSAGAAIVTTRGWCTESVWRDSNAVELVDPGEPLDAVAAIERLLRDSARCAELRRRALELYDRRFHVDRVVTRLRELGAANRAGAL